MIEQHLVPRAATRRNLDLLGAFGTDTWVFTTDSWLVRNPDGDYVARERRSIQAEPRVVGDFEPQPHLARAAKIVGSSTDFTRLAKCKLVIREALRGQASVVRRASKAAQRENAGLDVGAGADHGGIDDL